jgi:hypothetical protein
MNNKACQILALVTAALLGCTAVVAPVRYAMGKPGEVNADGRINPCVGYRTDQQLCGNALFNKKAINQVRAGQTTAEVRKFMKHDPERRQMETGIEEWTYITDYDAGQATTIVFEADKVTALRLVAW